MAALMNEQTLMEKIQKSIENGKYLNSLLKDAGVIFI